MSRDYRIVTLQGDIERFEKDGLSFNVNVMGAEYYGRIFRILGLPVDPMSHTIKDDDFVSFKHVYRGDDLEAVRAVMKDPDFKPKLINAICHANREMNCHDEIPEAVAHDMLTDIFPLFQDPDAIAVASDYCEEYYD